MKPIIHIGSNSVHLAAFVENISSVHHTQLLIAEEPCPFPEIHQLHQVNFRNLNPISIFRNYRLLKQILKNHADGIVHIHQLNRLAYFAARAASKLKIPIVATAWGSDVLLVPNESRFFRYLTTKTIERCDIVTADSQQMIRAMQQLVSSETKYHWVQYGIDIQSAASVKEKIIYSNRLHKPLYRIDAIIHYFAEFHTRHPEWKLIIGAIGSDTGKLKELAASLLPEHSFEFVGWLTPTDNQSYYAKSSIYISLPKSDGTSVSLLEAMSAKCLPVVSNLEVSHEWITPGVNGVIEKNSANPLFEALPLLIPDILEANKSRVDSSSSKATSRQFFTQIYQRLSQHA